MIAGIGIDMIEVERVSEKLMRNNGFREKIFSGTEIAYCESQLRSAESYAARFAAKEAFLKATGLGLMAGHSLSEIEILNNENGDPDIVLTGRFKSLFVEKGWQKIHVSLSHIASAACAVVVIEQ